LKLQTTADGEVRKKERENEEDDMDEWLTCGGYIKIAMGQKRKSGYIFEDNLDRWGDRKRLDI